MATKPCFTDPVDLQQKVDAYFEHCENSRTERELKNGDIRVRQESPSMIGLAVWLHCSTDTINSYTKIVFHDTLLVLIVHLCHFA